MELLYVCALGLSSLTLLGMAITRFGTDSVADRFLCGVFGLLIGWYTVYLVFLYTDGTVLFSFWPFLIPVYAGYRLVKGFRSRAADRAKRESYKAATAAADEWRTTRRW